jgi:hypothetical protein
MNEQIQPTPAGYTPVPAEGGPWPSYVEDGKKWNFVNVEEQSRFAAEMAKKHRKRTLALRIGGAVLVAVVIYFVVKKKG